MNKHYLISIILSTLFSLSIFAQDVGSFETTIEFNNRNHTLSFHVPEDYDSNNEYPLFVALHGCNGNSTAFRNNLVRFSSFNDIIVVCPDFFGGQMSGGNRQLILDAINETVDMGYSIDDAAVYLTGFSCNGQETYKHGWSEIYPFAGIIPFNAWIPNLNASYNIPTEMPTCVCIGTNDGSYANNIALYNDYSDNGGVALLNEMPGIGHQWDFQGRDTELLECYNWIKSLEVTSTNDLEGVKFDFEVFPNPSMDGYFLVQNEKNLQLSIEIINTAGHQIFKSESHESLIKIGTSTPEKGVYFVKVLDQKNNRVLTKKIIVKQ